MIPDWIQGFADEFGGVVTEIPGEPNHTVRNIVITIVVVIILIALIAR